MTTPYKRCEKRWKAMTPAQALTDPYLLDVRHLSADQQQRVRVVGTWAAAGAAERPILSFDGCGVLHEGFFVIPRALDAAAQLELAHACLTEYAEAPHVTNMHLQHEQVADIWRTARACRPDDPSSAPPLSKLHWAACGYHYEWTARKYFRERFSPVPAALEQLAQQCARVCGMSIAAEAVIVNFYKKSSTMGGHQDDVEYTMAHPVISLSLGSSSVFLKGGLTKDEPPLEVLLRSGDVAVLGGASRLSFHGVAKVLPLEGGFEMAPGQWEKLVANRPSEAVEDLAAVRRYLGSQRININVRQVFPLAEECEAAAEAGATAWEGGAEEKLERNLNGRRV
ncbi:hypothetical protein PybrP1_001725 [[Pythium] brassicae (nom. inval.)]|nr:hypothetical protein PybrP1_001725 [[Pythium] brassicae (nom. inval.)]